MFGEEINIISLTSGTVLNFRNETGIEKYLYLPAMSLLIISNEARYAWKHSIVPRKMDKVGNLIIFRKRRLSLTFKLKSGLPCKCLFP
jgi:alkylated DNA repair protein alkB family protein 8